MSTSEVAEPGASEMIPASGGYGRSSELEDAFPQLPGAIDNFLSSEAHRYQCQLTYIFDRCFLTTTMTGIHATDQLPVSTTPYFAHLSPLLLRARGTLQDLRLPRPASTQRTGLPATAILLPVHDTAL
jgi:hypothetical protein